MTSLLNHDQVADALQLTARQVARLARKGELPCVRLPGNEIRYDPDEIDRWIEERKAPPAEPRRAACQ